jgi:hypothetical protein
MTEKSILQLYTEALDRGDFEALGRLLEQNCETGDTGLEAAIDFIHQRFDTNESFTTQLIKLRNARQSLR